jgi:hypothetical protein
MLSTNKDYLENIPYDGSKNGILYNLPGHLLIHRDLTETGAGYSFRHFIA